MCVQLCTRRIPCWAFGDASDLISNFASAQMPQWSVAQCVRGDGPFTAIAGHLHQDMAARSRHAGCKWQEGVAFLFLGSWPQHTTMRAQRRRRDVKRAPIVNLPGDRLVRAALLLTAEMAGQDLRNGSGHRHGSFRRQGSAPPRPTAPAPSASMVRRRGPGTSAKRRLRMGRTVVQVARSHSQFERARPLACLLCPSPSELPSTADPILGSSQNVSPSPCRTPLSTYSTHTMPTLATIPFDQLPTTHPPEGVTMLSRAPTLSLSCLPTPNSLPHFSFGPPWRSQVQFSGSAVQRFRGSAV